MDTNDIIYGTEWKPAERAALLSKMIKNEFHLHLEEIPQVNICIKIVFQCTFITKKDIMIGVVQIKWIYMTSFMAQNENLLKEQLPFPKCSKMSSSGDDTT